jgi:hypothetical protein
MTLTLFRKLPESERVEAFFPTVPVSEGSPDLIAAYRGGSYPLDYVRKCRVAKPEEYEPLKRELLRQGFEVVIGTRLSKRDRQIRCALMRKAG